MFFIGIDIAKETHYAAVVSDNGEILAEPFAFANNRDGFNSLLSVLEPYNSAEVLIGLESTAHYGESLIFFLFQRGWPLAVSNPIQTATLRKAGIRKTKTDKIDSLLIVKSLRINTYRLYTKADIDTLTLKSLCRFRQNLKKSKARLKIQLVSYLDILFPELATFFKSGLHGNACYQLLKNHTLPKDIAALHLTYLSNLLRKASHGHFGKQNAIALKSLAKSSVGTGDPNLSIQVVHTIDQIEILEQQIADIEQSIESVMLSLDSVIVSVPGIGFINGAMILGVIGDIHRFQKPCQLLAYAGLDPKVNQSGKFNASHTRMSKRGSSMLRYALINAAWNVSLKNQTFKDYYDLKRSQGLGHYAALGHVAHKLVRVLFKMLKDNVTFDLP